MSALQAKYPEKPAQSRSRNPLGERPRRSALLRAIFFLAKCFAVLLLLCLAAVGGGLYWLRTPSAEKRILDEATTALAQQGMRLTAARLSGPLPQRIAIENLALSDAQGPLLAAARVELRWNMSALLSGTVALEAVELQDPEIFRLPPPSPDTPEESAPKTSEPFSLPVNIRLDSLKINGGRLHMAVLRPEAKPSPDAPALLFAVSGSASVSAKSLTGNLSCNLNVPDKGEIRLNLDLESGLPGEASGLFVSGREDSLSLDITASEKSGGPLSLLTNNPELPAYAFSLRGKGGIKDWRGTLSLLAGQDSATTPRSSGLAGADAPPAIRPDVLALSMDLGLRCATGSLWRDAILSPDVTVRMEAEAKPGERTPPSLLPLLGKAAKANIELAATGKRYRIQADASSSAWRLSLTDAVLQPAAAEESGTESNNSQAASWMRDTKRQKGALAFKAAIQAVLTDPSAFAAPEARPLPLRSASFKAFLNGGLSELVSGLELRGDLEAQTRDTTFTATCALDAESREQRIALHRLELRGLGITAEARADLDASSGAVSATADILAPDKADWQTLIAQLAGLSAPPAEKLPPTVANAHAPLGGEIRLNASLDIPGHTSAPGSGILRLTGSNMRWPTQQLADILGNSLNISAHLAAGKNAQSGKDVWTLSLEEARAGIFSAAGKALFTPPAKDEEASPARRASLPPAKPDAANVTPLNGKKDTSALATTPAKNGPVSPSAAGSLEAEFHAKVSDLGPLGPGLSGNLSALVKAKGPLDALDVRISADSPGLGTPNGVFQGVALRLTAQTAETPSVTAANDRKATSPGPTEAQTGNHEQTARDLTANGTLALTAANSPGGPLSLSGRWRVSLPANGQPIRASLDDFSAQGAGLKLSAALAASVAGQTAPSPTALPTTSAKSAAKTPDASAPPLPVSLKGELNADVEDWKKLASLAGTPLSGGPARLRLRLDDAGGTQSAALDLNVPSLLLKNAESGQTTFSVEELSAAFVLPRISIAAASLAPDFRLRMGRGLAGPLQWSSGGLTVKGFGGTGEFSLALNGKGQAPLQTGTPGKSSKTGGQPAQSGGSGIDSAEIFGLRGRYDLGRQEAVINALSLRLPARASTQDSEQRNRASAEAGGGFRLQKALNLKFADGLLLSGLDLAFQPGGRLTADAAIAPESMRIKADLQSLPFSFFALFTDAPLPGGTLGLLADLSSSPQGPRGNVTVKSRISPTHAQSGLVKNASRTGKPEGAAQQPATDAFDLRLTASLAASPGQSAAPGSGVRSLPGLIWLNGAGDFGRASAQDTAKEGRLAFQIPLRLAPNGLPLPDSAAPMAAGVHWNGSVAPLWQALPLPDRYLSGQAQVDLSVTGSLDKPKPALTAYFGQGRYEDIVAGALLTDIRLEAKLTPDGNLSALLAAGDGAKGTLALEAAVRGLLDQKTPTVHVRGQLNNLRPLHRDDLSIALSGIFGVKGSADAPAVSANIQVDEGEFTISPKLGGSVTTLDISPGSFASVPDERTGKPAVSDKKTLAPDKRTAASGAHAASGKTGVASGKTEAAEGKATEASGKATSASGKSPASPGKTKAASSKKTAPPDAAAAATAKHALAAQTSSGPSLDVRVTIPRQFFIRGMGIDSEWEGDLLIKGPTSDLSLTGALRPVRGQVDILSKTFTFTGGDISFTGGMRINPLLNLELTYEGSGLTALVRAAGTAKKPQLILESRPPLPRDEILAVVLFGKRASELSRFEAIQLANSLRELSSGGSGMNVLTGIRKTVGLDVLRLGAGDQARERTTSGQSGEGALTGQKGGKEESAGGPTLEAGKYINDSIYIGVEQGATPESTAVRVEVELFPSVNVQGQSSATATEIGIGWKKDY